MTSLGPYLNMKQLYVTCVLCRGGGIVEYPPEQDIDYLIGNTQSSLTHVSTVVCGGCETQRENETAIEYFQDYGVPVDYIKSTLVYREAELFRQQAPTIVLTDYRAEPLLLYELVSNVKNTCTLYSMEYDDRRLFPSPANEYFFGVHKL